jgi:AraC-like DNA-binding protein
MTEVLINPRAAFLGVQNAVLNATSRGVYESRFTGPLSIKAVIRGSATWETRDGRFEIAPGCVLLIHDGEEYAIANDRLQSVETFVFFFERGFVEDAWRSLTTSSAKLLDDSHDAASIFFAERLHFAPPLVDEVRRAHARLRADEPLGVSFYAAAAELVRVQCDLDACVSRLPSLRATTRDELAKRIRIATSFLHANLDRPVTIAEVAREACLSPFHFHRLFTAFHGTTPHRYLTRLRLERARTLLASSERPVAEIALACGFESASSFTTLFTRSFGEPPKKARMKKPPAFPGDTIAS